jgi:hypothetical protein
MTDTTHEQGVVLAAVERFARSTLPRALDIKAKVDGGERLDDIACGDEAEVTEGRIAAAALVDPCVAQPERRSFQRSPPLASTEG